MTTEFVQANYETLASIKQRFEQCAGEVQDLQTRLTQQVEEFCQDGWQGRGSAAFFGEMQQTIFPAIQRLSDALQQGGEVSGQIGTLLQQAEEEASSRFKGNEGGLMGLLGGGGGGGFASAAFATAGLGSLGGLGIISPVASVVGNIMKGVFGSQVMQTRYVLRALTPNIARGNTTVAMLMDMAAGRRGLPLMRFDGPHGGTPTPHINLHPQLTGFPDPHTPISPRLLNIMGKGARILEGAQKIAVPVAIAVDVFRLGSAFHSDGNQIGGETKRTIGSVAGGWGGALAGAKAGAVGGAWIGGAIGSIIPGAGTAVGAGVGGFLGGLGGGIAGAVGGSWIGEKIGGLF